MTEETQNKYSKYPILENWRIERVFMDESMMFAAPVIDGFVNGQRIRRDLLTWLDLEEGIAMTRSNVFKVGQPNPQWMGVFLAQGNDPGDLEIKGTTH